MKTFKITALSIVMTILAITLTFALCLAASADETCPLKGSATNYGDANGDGKVDNLDLAHLAQYLANYDSTTGTSSVRLGPEFIAHEYEGEYGDANGDGKVDNLDLAHLAQYLANYDSTTGTSSVRLGPEFIAHEYMCEVVSEEYLAAPATCTSPARYYYSCACGKAGDASFAYGDAIGHAYGEWIAEVPVSCTEDGAIAHYHCSACGKNFDENHVEIEDVVIPAHHQYSDEWSSDYFAHWHERICECEESDDIIPVVGYEEHVYEGNAHTCSICGAIRTVEVIFEDNDGSVIDVQRVEYEGNADEPEEAVPDKGNYYFFDWIIGYTGVTQNTVVTASYKKYLTVTFFDYDGSVLAVKYVKSGEDVALPDEDELGLSQEGHREGYTFVGWGDVSFTNVTEDMEVVAQYQLNTYTVTFVTSDGKTIEEQTVAYGLSAIEPPNSEIFPKYHCGDEEVTATQFSGWTYVEGDEEISVSSDELKTFPIKQNITFTAQYGKPIDNPVVVVRKRTGIDSTSLLQTKVIWLYLSMPADQELSLFALNLRVDWKSTQIGGFGAIADYLTDIKDHNGNKTAVSQRGYSSKNSYFTLSWAFAEGIGGEELNEIEEYKRNTTPVIWAVFGDNPILSLSEDSYLLVGTSVDDVVAVRPDILILED